MKTTFRNLILLCLTFFGIASNVNAQQSFDDNCCYNSNPQQCFDDNCCYNPCCECDCGRFSAGGAWLYWRATEDGLNYAYKNTTVPTSIPGETISENKILNPAFEYDSGFRVYVGYTLPCYDYELDVIYTHVGNSRPRSSAVTLLPNTGTGPTQNITQITDNFLGNITQASLTGSGDPNNAIKLLWGLDLDYIDFDLSHALCLCDYLRFRPHIGVRYLWAKQGLNQVITGTIGATPIIIPFTTSGFLQNWTHGVGAEGGIWGDWDIGCGFSILGHVGGSILYGKHKIHGTTVTSFGSTTPDVVRFYHDVEYSSIPMLDFFIGLEYAVCLCDFEIDFLVGWEQHTLFGMNRFTTTDGGELALQGLTLGAGFAF